MFASVRSDHFAMALNGFSVLLFVSAAPKLFAGNKKNFIYYAFCLLLLQLQFSHSAIENKVCYDLTTALYHFSNKARKQIDRPEVIGVAMAAPPPH